jgi:hypothetical protein
MTDELEPLSVQYSGGWVGFEAGLPVAAGSTLALPDVSIETLAMQEVRDQRAAAQRAAVLEDRESNQAQAARMAGYSATSVDAVLARVRQETVVSDRRAERHRQLEQPYSVLTEREITEERLRASRMAGSRPGRASRLARVAEILHPVREQARDHARGRMYRHWSHFAGTGGD